MQLDPQTRLTPRESEILQLLAEGNSMKQISGMLTISQRTVAFHKYKMMERLGIGTNAALLQYAMRRYMTPAAGNWAITDASGTRLMEAGYALFCCSSRHGYGLVTRFNAKGEIE